MKKFPIIRLASKSPRRRMLLSQMDVEFTVHDLNCDESYPNSLQGTEVAEFIVNRKSEAAKDQITANGIILCADTIVLHENKILEKPDNLAEAKNTLQKLSGESHTVTTAVALTENEKSVVFGSESTVHFKELDMEEIEYYLEKYVPLDKAGAYAIQEWIGHCKIERIEGSYNNIIGLPTARVYEQLKSW